MQKKKDKQFPNKVTHLYNVEGCVNFEHVLNFE